MFEFVAITSGQSIAGIPELYGVSLELGGLLLRKLFSGEREDICVDANVRERRG